MPGGFAVVYTLCKIKKLPCSNFMWFLDPLNLKSYQEFILKTMKFLQ